MDEAKEGDQTDVPESKVGSDGLPVTGGAGSAAVDAAAAADADPEKAEDEVKALVEEAPGHELEVNLYSLASYYLVGFLITFIPAAVVTFAWSTSPRRF